MVDSTRALEEEYAKNVSEASTVYVFDGVWRGFG
jgi:hypothetical protein